MRLPPLLLLFALVCGAPPPASAGVLSAQADCNGLGQIVVDWTWSENPFSPVDVPAWIGYDIHRRDVNACDAFVRVNPEPILREPGSHARQYVDTPPATQTTYEYRVIPIDASRQRILLGTQNCEPPCTGLAWPSCPNLTSPVTAGKLIDHGWALFLEPCPDGCWPYVYVSGADADALRPYADGVQTVALFGTAFCGSVEGCALDVDHFELMACGAVPARASTWGRVKVMYR